MHKEGEPGLKRILAEARLRPGYTGLLVVLALHPLATREELIALSGLSSSKSQEKPGSATNLNSRVERYLANMRKAGLVGSFLYYSYHPSSHSSFFSSAGVVNDHSSITVSGYSEGTDEVESSTLKPEKGAKKQVKVRCHYYLTPAGVKALAALMLENDIDLPEGEEKFIDKYGVKEEQLPVLSRGLESQGQVQLFLEKLVLALDNALACGTRFKLGWQYSAELLWQQNLNVSIRSARFDAAALVSSFSVFDQESNSSSTCFTSGRRTLLVMADAELLPPSFIPRYLHSWLVALRRDNTAVYPVPPVLPLPGSCLRDQLERLVRQESASIEFEKRADFNPVLVIITRSGERLAVWQAVLEEKILYFRVKPPDVAGFTEDELLSMVSKEDLNSFLHKLQVNTDPFIEEEFRKNYCTDQAVDANQSCFNTSFVKSVLTSYMAVRGKRKRPSFTATASPGRETLMYLHIMPRLRRVLLILHIYGQQEKNALATLAGLETGVLNRDLALLEQLGFTSHVTSSKITGFGSRKKMVVFLTDKGVEAVRFIAGALIGFDPAYRLYRKRINRRKLVSEEEICQTWRNDNFFEDPLDRKSLLSTLSFSTVHSCRVNSFFCRLIEAGYGLQTSQLTGKVSGRDSSSLGEELLSEMVLPGSRLTSWQSEPYCHRYFINPVLLSAYLHQTAKPDPSALYNPWRMLHKLSTGTVHLRDLSIPIEQLLPDGYGILEDFQGRKYEFFLEYERFTRHHSERYLGKVFSYVKWQWYRALLAGICGTSPEPLNLLLVTPDTLTERKLAAVFEIGTIIVTTWLSLTAPLGVENLPAFPGVSADFNPLVEENL
ncbi:MAG TPA: hypothetical protein VH186_36030, partial [Chloroflexia bacterium]|nr:hypothetical protein [Chloroflexia bacterium]